jgi:hypothetical protein
MTNNKTVYSQSRLSVFDNCKLKYRHSYIDCRWKMGSGLVFLQNYLHHLGGKDAEGDND